MMCAVSNSLLECKLCIHYMPLSSSSYQYQPEISQYEANSQASIALFPTRKSTFQVVETIWYNRALKNWGTQLLTDCKVPRIVVQKTSCVMF